ncbi:MAG TPA: ATP-binding protein, partial [Caulobacteraceae bacterium]|nr:ATP-binding protein [Caulobacteraceae bacterium]
PIRVRQILHNLVSNAVKFTEAGAVSVRADHDGERLTLAVRDTGPGIPLERVEALFGKFVQADATTTRRFGGSGLGLAICRDLATLMGGDVRVVTAPGRGSTFTARLSLPRATAPAPAAPAPEPATASGLRVLAAEDNPMNQLVLRTLMDQLGVELRIVGDGAAAVEAARQAPWDVILMDVQMPVMDGPTAAGRIRDDERRLGSPRTPIVALTANAMAHQEAEYRAAGMDGVVAKPIQLDRLVAAIAQVTDGRTPAAVCG